MTFADLLEVLPKNMGISVYNTWEDEVGDEDGGIVFSGVVRDIPEEMIREFSENHVTQIYFEESPDSDKEISLMNGENGELIITVKNILTIELEE